MASISCGIEDPAREMWTLRRRGGGEREGELGADPYSQLPAKDLAKHFLVGLAYRKQPK